jgi:hypothetical protein
MRALTVVTAAVVAAKLVIMTPNGVAVTDFQTMNQCEQARAILLQKVLNDAEARAPKGYHVLLPPATSAVCIPA